MKARLLYLLPVLLNVGSLNLGVAIINAKNNGDLNSTNTWAGGIVPTAGDIVNIDGYDIFISSGSITCQDIDITSYPSLFLGLGVTGILTVKSGVTLNITGNLSPTTQDLNAGIYLLEFSGDSKQKIAKLFIR
ncbi:MAG: hypothetical protein ACJAUV_001413 [Flavobacteriales bacterium]|jgi:hypothetical protein